MFSERNLATFASSAFFGGSVEALLGSLGGLVGRLEAILDRRGATLGRLDALLGCLGALLGPSWAILGLFGGSGGPGGAFRSPETPPPSNRILDLGGGGRGRGTAKCLTRLFTPSKRGSADFSKRLVL